MAHPSHSTPSKLSAFKARLRAHVAIARSLSPFCTHTARLDSSNYAVTSFLAISGCMCSTTSAITDAQVPTRRCNADNVRQVRSLHGNLKGKHVSKTGSQKDMHKKRFSGSFNKSNSRVSDVSAGTPCHMGRAPVSSKSEDNVNTLIKDMQDETKGYGRSNSHSPCKSMSENCAATGIFGGRRSESTSNKPVKQAYSCKREKLSVTNFTKGYLPEVMYTYDPCKAFYESMLNMVMVRSRDVYDYNLEDMCACYLMLNSSHHQEHIEEAFEKLLTDLYRSKVLQISGVDSCGEMITA